MSNSSETSKKPFLQELRRILSDGIRRIDNDECDEGSAMQMVSRFNLETNSHFEKKRFVNYDEAMRMTGIRQRTQFRRVCDEHGIEQKLVNNIKVGFLRSDIESLVESLKEERRLKT